MCSFRVSHLSAPNITSALKFFWISWKLVLFNKFSIGRSWSIKCSKDQLQIVESNLLQTVLTILKRRNKTKTLAHSKYRYVKDYKLRYKGREIESNKKAANFNIWNIWVSMMPRNHDETRSDKVKSNSLHDGAIRYSLYTYTRTVDLRWPCKPIFLEHCTAFL